MVTKRRAFGLAAVAAFSFCCVVYAQPDADKPAGRGRSVDEVFTEIETMVPGFGGLFKDGQGRLTVYVTGTADVDQVRAGIAAHLPEAAAQTSSIRILRGDFAFSELVAWRAQARAVHSIPGVALTDVDEASNRVRVGIETEEARVKVEEALATLGIPPGAVEIEVTGPYSYTASVQDFIRPVIGGIQVTFDCDAVSCFVCTDGFLAIRKGVKGFVTNSHCTKTQGGNQSTAHFQPFPSAKIGTEIADPLYFTAVPCPVGRACRFSDSAFVKRKKKTKWSTGFIAHPTALGSLTIDTSTPTFRITSETALPLDGDMANKVGRTTGWSQGKIDGTCLDVNVSGTNLTLLCQDAVDATVAGGDSGSPVFSDPSGVTQDVSLYGVLWGGNQAGNQFIFSRLPNIEGELTVLKTCDPSIGC